MGSEVEMDNKYFFGQLIFIHFATKILYLVFLQYFLEKIYSILSKIREKISFFKIPQKFPNSPKTFKFIKSVFFGEKIPECGNPVFVFFLKPSV